MFARREGHLIFFNEGCNVTVADYRALPFLYTENTVIDFDLKVSLYFALTSKTPMFLDFLARKMSFFGIKDFTSSTDDLALALSAGPFATAGTGKLDAFGCESTQQGTSLLNLYRVFSVYGNFDCSGGRKIILCNEQYNYQCENDDQKDTDTRQNE